MTSALKEPKMEPASQLVVPDAPYSKRGELAAPAGQPANLMQALAVAAADPRMELAKVQGLWAMHKEMMDREAAAAFADAMARAQSRIQPISKNRKNDHTKSKYATLDAIVEEVTPIVSAEGLSVSYDNFDQERDKGLPALKEGWNRVIAFVSRGAHTRKHHLDGPLDDKGTQGITNKTGIQAMGSTVSYLRRYLFCMIFNIATADDNDGNAGGNGSSGRLDEKKLADHLAAMEGCSDEASVLKAFAKGYNEAEDLKDKDSQRVLMAKRDDCRKKLRPPRRS